MEIGGHSTLLFETQSLFDLLWAGFSPDGLSFNRLREFAVMLGQVAIEHRYRQLASKHSLNNFQPFLFLHRQGCHPHTLT